jgi:hypothetical protein
VLGSHAHLVAEVDGEPAGQVEGWLERIGPSSPLVCEVRSLIVAARARNLGLGRALLDGLAKVALESEGGSRPCILAAEVLEPNPAHGFYGRVGFSPVAYSAALAPRALGAGGRARAERFTARPATPSDAADIARLEGVLAVRRRASGDTRFEPPRAVDATVLTVVAGQIAADLRDQGDATTLLVLDRTGFVRGAASALVQTLDPPFVPVRRALVGRFALDPSLPPAVLVPPLVALGCRFAELRGAIRVELTDLTAPGTELHEAALATGARPWSRVVLRTSPVPCPLPPRG